MLRKVVALAFFTVCGGCSLLTSLEGFSSGSPDAGPAPLADAATESGAETGTPPTDGGVDGAIPTDATVDTGTDAGPPPNIHPNGTFEASLDPWGAYQGTIAPDATAHTGARSLRVCGGTNVDYFTADDNSALVGPSIGATYRAEGWVRTAPGAVTPPSINIFLRTVDLSRGFEVVELGQNEGAPLTSTWQKLSVTLKVTKPAERLGVFVGADWVAGACFLLDDVTLQRFD